MFKRRTREEWSALVAAYGEGTQPAAQFCARHQLHPRTFAWWRSKLRARAVTPPDYAVRLLPVKVTGEPSRGTRHEVMILVAGVEVHVETTADVAYVAALVARIRAS